MSARLIHPNGPPGIGKSTLAAVYADRHPGTLNLDVDTLHHLVGGWQDEEIDTWPVVWSLVRAMAATHLDGGREVVLPQYQATVDEIAGLETLAREPAPPSGRSSCSTTGRRRSGVSTAAPRTATTRGSGTTTV